MKLFCMENSGFISNVVFRIGWEDLTSDSPWFCHWHGLNVAVSDVFGPHMVTCVCMLSGDRHTDILRIQVGWALRASSGLWPEGAW